jgi:glutathione S-transferase
MSAQLSPSLNLHGDAFWISPWVFSCFVALREKAVPFEVKEVALHQKEQLRADYKAASLTARVPALAHGDFWLAESLAILEYLEEAFPPPEHARLLPASMHDRARARQVLSWLRSDDTLPIRQERSSETIFYARPARPPLTDGGRKASDKLFEVVGKLVQGPSSMVFGTWTVVDAELAFFLQRLIVAGDQVPASLRGYAEKQWKRPSVAEYVAHDRVPFVPYF